MKKKKALKRLMYTDIGVVDWHEDFCKYLDGENPNVGEYVRACKNTWIENGLHPHDVNFKHHFRKAVKRGFEMHKEKAA